MGNCLVTKLAAVVNNDNLEKLGIGSIHYNTLSTVPSHYNILSLEFNKDTTITLVSDDPSLQFYSNEARTNGIGKTASFTAGVKKNVFAPNGTFDVEFEKYALVQFDCGSTSDCRNMVINTSSFRGSLLIDIVVPYIWASGVGVNVPCALWKGSLSDLPDTLLHIKCGFAGGSDMKLSDLNHLGSLIDLSTNGTGISGNVDTDLTAVNPILRLQCASNISCTVERYIQNIENVSTNINLGYLKITGDVETLLEAWYNSHDNGAGNYVASMNRAGLKFKNAAYLWENCYAVIENNVLKYYSGGTTAQTATVLRAEYNGTTWTYHF